jgi:hypothetical protein
LFTDGFERDVYHDAHGRTYVLDDCGQPVYGAWLLDDDGADVPVIVSAAVPR